MVLLNYIVPDPRLFIWIPASVANITAVNANGSKTLLAKIVSTFFYNGKAAAIKYLRKLRIRPSPLVIVLVVSFNVK